MSSQLKILFIGSNPSHKASSTEAFTEDTVSGRILRDWVKGIEGTILYDNIVSSVTENNRPLNGNEITDAKTGLSDRIKEINPERIVALGKAASSVLSKLGFKHLGMPHPSGLNRQLNDKAYTTAKIEELKRYCQE